MVSRAFSCSVPALSLLSAASRPSLGLGDVASSFAALLLGAGLFAGLGMGGGLVYRPVLLLLGWNDHYAIATSCMLVTASGTVAGLVFAKLQCADTRLAAVVGVAAAAGSFVGGLTAPGLSELTLSAFTSVGLAVAVVLSLVNRRRRGSAPETEGPSREETQEPDETQVSGCGPSGSSIDTEHTKPKPHGWGRWARATGGHSYSIRLPVLIPASLAAGFSAAWIGIGGGLFMVPLLIGPFRIPPLVAVGTSAWVVIIVGLTASVGHAVGGTFAGWAGLALVPGVAIGAALGAWAASRLRHSSLRWLVTAVCTTVCLAFVARTIWLLR